MSFSLILACFWLVISNVIGMTPSKDNHWRNAYILIALGLPILVYVFVQHGPWVGLLVLAGAASVLRWPVIYLARWMRQKLRGDQDKAE